MTTTDLLLIIITCGASFSGNARRCNDFASRNDLHCRAMPHFALSGCAPFVNFFMVQSPWGYLHLSTYTGLAEMPDLLPDTLLVLSYCLYLSV